MGKKFLGITYSFMRKIILIVGLCISLSAAFLCSRWNNVSEASLCPPDWCCVLSSFSVETPSGVTTFLFATCGFISITVWNDGTVSGGGCNASGCIII